MTLTALAIMVVLLFVNGFFVAAEFAFTAASRHQLADRPGSGARAALKSIDELSFTLAGAQFGITIASLLLGAVAEPAVAGIIESVIGRFVEIPENLLHSIGFVLALTIVVFLHMVIGEMVPKNIAITDPERSSVLLALPFRGFSTLFRPLIWVLNAVANIGLRMVGVDPTDTKEVHTSDDLASLITAGRREGVVEDFAHRLLTGAIDLWDLHASEVMIPRTEVSALPLASTVADVERTVVEKGYSRIPLYDGTLDEVCGFVHVKDLLAVPDDGVDGPIPTELIRETLAVPESASVGHVLESMRRSRSHLAFVVDEHGGIAGIVTMEDIVEEVVGEIRDEHDREHGGIRRAGPGRFLVKASMRPDEVLRVCGVALPDGDYDTIGGLVMDRIGRIPVVGDSFGEDAWTIRVRQMAGLRVGEVELLIEGRGER